MTRTDELIQLADAATPGPWRKAAHGVVLTNRGEGEADYIVMWDASPANIALDTMYIVAANPQTVKQMATLMRQMAEALKQASVVACDEGTGQLPEVEEALVAYEHFEKGE